MLSSQRKRLGPRRERAQSTNARRGPGSTRVALSTGGTTGDEKEGGGAGVESVKKHGRQPSTAGGRSGPTRRRQRRTGKRRQDREARYRKERMAVTEPADGGTRVNVSSANVSVRTPQAQRQGSDVGQRASVDRYDGDASSSLGGGGRISQSTTIKHRTGDWG